MFPQKISWGQRSWIGYEFSRESTTANQCWRGLTYFFLLNCQFPLRVCVLLKLLFYSDCLLKGIHSNKGSKFYLSGADIKPTTPFFPSWYNVWPWAFSNIYFIVKTMLSSLFTFLRWNVENLWTFISSKINCLWTEWYTFPHILGERFGCLWGRCFMSWTWKPKWAGSSGTSYQERRFCS